MFTHILLPTDGSFRSEAAVRFGIRLAQRVGARATGLTVVPRAPRTDASDGGFDEAESLAQSNLDFVETVARGNSVQCELVVAHGRKPYEHIIAAAEGLGCDLIVMATHGREGVEAFVLGSQTQKVLARSAVPVLVCRD